MEFHWGDIKICLYFTLKESKLIFKSVSKTFLFKTASLKDNKLFPIFVRFVFAHLKYVSLEVIVWFSFNSTQSKDGWCVLTVLCSKIECLYYINRLGRARLQFLWTLMNDSIISGHLLEIFRAVAEADVPKAADSVSFNARKSI